MDTVATLLGQEVPGAGGGDEVVALPPLVLHRVRHGGEGAEGDGEQSKVIEIERLRD